MDRLDVIIFLSTIGVFVVLAVIFTALLYATGWNLMYVLPFSFLMLFIQWYIGPFMVKVFTGAKEVSEEEAPELHKMVEELAKKAGIPKPKVCIVNNPSPNAFAFGRTQKSSYVAVHTGLMDVLSKEEVKAVLAHEIGHIKHRDVFVITMASVLPVLLYWGVIFALRGRGRGRQNPFAVWMGALFAKFIGQLAVLWLSRQREFFADAFSKKVMGDPLPLGRALVKISYSLNKYREIENPSMKAFYIGEAEHLSEDVLRAVSGGKEDIMEAIKRDEGMDILELFSTHPRTVKRLKALFS
ncbi:MAG: zinc metalloprotease HtpX [Candidatus Anstonellales archaeon]